MQLESRTRSDLHEGVAHDGVGRTGDRTLDASDVVEGPVGSASLREPGEPMGADLSKLPQIEAPDGGEDAS